MQPYFTQVTQAGYDRIEAEINAIKADRPTKIAALAAARALGDLSENAEYSAAKRDLRHLESRLRFLDKQLRYAKVVTPKDDQTIEIGKTVTLTFLDVNDVDTFDLVGTPEADVTTNKISLASPIGAAIMGHSVGDSVMVDAPNGQYQITISDVSITK